VQKQKKSGKGGKAGIKKADMQAVLAGFTNAGKSTLFSILTDQKTKTAPTQFTTSEPKIGNFYFEDVPIQLIDTPSFPNPDKNLINTADTILFVIGSLDQIEEAEKYLYRTKAKIILIYNKEDLLSEKEKRKIKATLQSKFKKYGFFMISSKSSNKIKIEKLKEKIFETFPIIRVYTKEPKKEPSKTPMILKNDATISMAAEKILKGMSKKVKKAKIWGPSSKFGGQTIGLNHQLKDKDIVEFQTT